MPRSGAVGDGRPSKSERLAPWDLAAPQSAHQALEAEVEPLAETLATQIRELGICQNGLRWAFARRDTSNVARLVTMARRAGISSTTPPVADAIVFLLDQQREDGSFGPTEPTRTRPRYLGTSLALLALINCQGDG